MRVLTEIDRSERVHLVQGDHQVDSANPSREPMRFHRQLPGYAPTPLLAAPTIAAQLGLKRLWVKDESSRMGLPAFKIMGASWAVYRAAKEMLEHRTGRALESWSTIEELAGRFAPLRPMTLACATDGNHGRAVARMAKLLGFSARILVPSDMSPARIEAIGGEGAEVIVHDGTYDEAVARSAGEVGERTLVISDTSWPGYEAVPRWVIEGYSTILWEVDDEISKLNEEPPDLVAVQIGVGAFAAAVVGHFRQRDITVEPFILGVEPAHAACALSSIEAGEIVELPGPHDSIMSGLNCGIPSPLAWPVISRGIDAFIAIDDERARVAMRALAGEGIVAGECGAAGIAGLMTWNEDFGGNLSGKRALVISTEGATDKAAYDRIIAGGA